MERQKLQCAKGANQHVSWRSFIISHLTDPYNPEITSALQIQSSVISVNQLKAQLNFIGGLQPDTFDTRLKCWANNGPTVFPET